jgi:hypothetical protein
VNVQSWKYAAALAAAIIVPYQVMRSDNAPDETHPAEQWWESMWQTEGRSPSDEGFTPIQSVPVAPWNEQATLSRASPPANREAERMPFDPTQSGADTSRLNTALAGKAMPHATGTVLQPLAQLLRFDLLPGWIMQQFPQVWTHQVTGDETAYRVTLVSGTRPTDITGALTYVFHQQQGLQRIQLDGQTGDPSELIAVVAQYHGLRNEPALGTSILVSRGPKRQPISILRIQPGSRILHSRSYQRFQIALELNRPGPNTVLGDRWQEIPGLIDRPHAEAATTVNSSKPGNSAETGHTPAPTKPTPRSESHAGPRRPNTDRLAPHSR